MAHTLNFYVNFLQRYCFACIKKYFLPAFRFYDIKCARLDRKCGKKFKYAEIQNAINLKVRINRKCKYAPEVTIFCLQMLRKSEIQRIDTAKFLLFHWMSLSIELINIEYKTREYIQFDRLDDWVPARLHLRYQPKGRTALNRDLFVFHYFLLLKIFNKYWIYLF